MALVLEAMRQKFPAHPESAPVPANTILGAGLSRALGIAALALAIAVIFEPGLAPGLHYTAGTGGMEGM